MASNFHTLIESLMSVDNNARSAAEAAFNEAKKQPEPLVSGLVQCAVSSPRDEVSLFHTSAFKQFVINPNIFLYVHIRTL